MVWHHRSLSWGWLKHSAQREDEDVCSRLLTAYWICIVDTISRGHHQILQVMRSRLGLFNVFLSLQVEYPEATLEQFIRTITDFVQMDLVLEAWVNNKKRKINFEKYSRKVLCTWETWKMFLHTEHVIIFPVINGYVCVWNLSFIFST